MNCRFSLWGVLVLLLVFGSTVTAQQGSSGSINGTVTDPTGAVIPGASVKATENSTNVTTTTQTTSAGIYNFSTLPPGNYRLTITHTGFRSTEISTIDLHVAQLMTVNIKLEVGQATEIVTISDVTTVETSATQISRYVTQKELDSWPLPVSTDGQRLLNEFIFKSLPGTVGNGFQGSINGGRRYSMEVAIDGISVGSFSTNELQPSVDAVGEFNLQTGSMGAQYGGGQTAIASYNTKSGTNNIHGSVYSYIQNEIFNSNSFLNNASGGKKPKQRLNSFGFSAGGPVYLPKFLGPLSYNGKDKTFWFLSDEWTMKRNFIFSGTTTMPTQDMLNGDLSKFLDPRYTRDQRSGKLISTKDRNNPFTGLSGDTPVKDLLGRPVIFGTVYDPNTTRVLNAGERDPITGLVASQRGIVRDPFTGNIIPKNRFDRVAREYLKLKLPTNYMNDLLSDNILTYTGNQPVFDQNLITLKLDHSINEAHRLSFLLTTTARDRSNSANPTWSIPGSSALDTWHFQHNPGKIIRLSETWTISPNIVNRFAVGYNRFTNIYLLPSEIRDTNWAETLGIENTEDYGFPRLTFSGIGGINGLGNSQNGSGDVTQSTIFQDQISVNHGAHQLQVGGEMRFYNQNNIVYSSVGTFAFGAGATSSGNQNGNVTGNAFASFLLGQAANANRTIAQNSFGFRRRLFSTWIQDSWRTTQKLTLNYGVRWDILGGLYEVNGRTTRTNISLPNAGAGGLPGALEFASQLNKKGFQNTNFGFIGPRLGFAYAFNPKLVLRGGYGLNFLAPQTGPGLEFGGNGSTSGYNGDITVDNTSNPQATSEIAPHILSRGFPSFTGVIPNFNPTLLNGRNAPGYIDSNVNTMAHSHNYTFGVQFEFMRNTVLDINYIGNYSYKLTGGGLGNLNQVPYSALAQYGGSLLDTLKSHPEIASPFPGFNRDNEVRQALRPYPQYGNLSQYDAHFGWSRYDSLQILVARRVSNGLSLLGAYTWAKSFTNLMGGMQDVVDRGRERTLNADVYVPHQFKMTLIYNLPIGPGKLINLTGWKNALFGGWALSGNGIYQYGSFLAVTDGGVTNGIYASTRPDIVLGENLRGDDSGKIDVKAQTGIQYLNPKAFKRVPTSTKNNVALRAGTAPKYLDITGPPVFYEAANLQKSFKAKERFDFLLRFDAFNMFNRPGKSNPIMDINNKDFGKIMNPGTGSYGGLDGFYQPRTIQVSLRLGF